MLLVKLRELKSLGKTSLKSVVCIIPLCTLSTSSVAESTSTSPDIATIMSIFMSLFIVIAIIFGLSYMMRRFTGGSHGNGQMKVVSSMMAGTKERIMVLQVGNEQHLIGVTSNNINLLATLQEHIEPNQTFAKSLTTNESGSFKDKLVEAMTSGIQNKMGSKKDDNNEK